MFERVWVFQATPGREGEFEIVYGQAGSWAQLFAQAAGYRGTELQRSTDEPRTFVVIDRWESRMAWDAFRHVHAAAYEALDRVCAPLVETESLAREGESAAP